MVISPLSLGFLATAVLFGLCAWFLLLLRREKVRAYVWGNRLWWIKTIEFCRRLTFSLCLICLCGGLAPLLISLLFAIIVIYLQIQEAVVRNRRETTVLGATLLRVHRAGGSPPDLLEAYGRSFANVLGAKAIATGLAMRRGESLLSASQRFGLRLPTTIRLLLSLPPEELPKQNLETNTQATLDGLSPALARLNWITVYIPVLMMLSFGMWLFAEQVLYPVFNEMREGYEDKLFFSDRMMKITFWVSYGMNLALALFMMYIGLILLLWLVGFERSLYWLPWVGRMVRQRRKIAILQALAIATQRGTSLPDAIRSLSTLSSMGGERPVLLAMVRDIESGANWNRSMERLVSSRDLVWLAAAEKNRQLPEAMRRLAEVIDYRLGRYLELNASIVAPLLMVAAAIPAAIFAYMVILFLSDLIWMLA